MSQKLVAVLLGALLVAMVTGAPASSRGVHSSPPEKRADEAILFGNHQNSARGMNKRGEPGDLDPQVDTPALGELDDGSEVIVHKEAPVEKDLAERADAARKDFEDQGKIADAMEAAMESVDNFASEQGKSDEAESEGAPESVQAEQTSAETSDSASSTADDTSSSDGEDGGEGAEVSDESEADEDADIKDLLQVTGDNHEEAQAADDQTTNEESSQQAGQEDDVSSQAAGFPQASTSEESGAPVAEAGLGPEAQPDDTRQQELGDFWRQMYQYMDAYPGNARLSFDLYRRRRSLMGSKRAGSRRIKRDLLDDVEYDPDLIRYLYSNSDDGIDSASDAQYDEPPTSSVLDMGDSLLADQDDYVPLTDSDAEDLYNELEEYLQWELQRRAGADKLRETLGLAPTQEDFTKEDDENGDLGGFYGDEAESGQDGESESESSLLADNSPMYYPYGVEYPSDSPYFYPSKRGSAGYELPAEEAEKRYFFPFADEPETHWGAFVPEKREVSAGVERAAYLDDPYLDDYRSPSKRDYNEAIHRLQRLAMALSDNRGPYFTELVQDQPFKK